MRLSATLGAQIPGGTPQIPWSKKPGANLPWAIFLCHLDGSPPTQGSKLASLSLPFPHGRKPWVRRREGFPNPCRLVHAHAACESQGCRRCHPSIPWSVHTQWLVTSGARFPTVGDSISQRSAVTLLPKSTAPCQSLEITSATLTPTTAALLLHHHRFTIHLCRSILLRPHSLPQQ